MRPATIIRSVLLPQPLGPMTETNSPSRMASEIDPSAEYVPLPTTYSLLTPWMSRNAVPTALAVIADPGDKELEDPVETEPDQTDEQDVHDDGCDAEVVPGIPDGVANAA